MSPILKLSLLTETVTHSPRATPALRSSGDSDSHRPPAKAHHYGWCHAFAGNLYSDGCMSTAATDRRAASSFGGYTDVTRMAVIS